MIKLRHKYMGIFDVLKSTASILKEANKIEEYQKILDAQGTLLDMQKRMSDLETENKELTELLKIQENLVFDNNAYWIKKDGNNDGPFCTCCWDSDKKPIRMMPSSHPAYVNCPKCSNKNVKVYPGREPLPQASMPRRNPAI